MDKRVWIQFFVIPILNSAVAFLRSKDANYTGADDDAADAAEVAVVALEKYVSLPGDEPYPTPDRPKPGSKRRK
jgi:hypothetical protein